MNAPERPLEDITGSHRGALDLLKKKKKASTRPTEVAAAANKAKADVDLDQSMRAALHYLAKVAKELNGVNPTGGVHTITSTLGGSPP